MATDKVTIGLNGFRVSVSPGQFTALVQELPDSGRLDQLRAEAGDRSTLWWNRGLLYELPRRSGTTSAHAGEKTLEVYDHLGFIAYLINAALPGAIPHYEAFRARPFTFWPSNANSCGFAQPPGADPRWHRRQEPAGDS